MDQAMLHSEEAAAIPEGYRIDTGLKREAMF
jgi:hypothetical protein